MKIKKRDTSVVWILVVALAIILAFVALVIFGTGRSKFVKDFVLFSADNFVNANVYVENEDATVMLNDQNVRNLSTIMVSGEMYYRTSKLEYTGDTITFTFEKKDTGELAYAKISKLSDGRSVVTVTNYAGEEKSVKLNDVKYSAFVRLSAVHSPNGDNTVIE